MLGKMLRGLERRKKDVVEKEIRESLQDKTFEMVPWGSSEDGHYITKLSFESVPGNGSH